MAGNNMEEEFLIGTLTSYEQVYEYGTFTVYLQRIIRLTIYPNINILDTYLFGNADQLLEEGF